MSIELQPQSVLFSPDADMEMFETYGNLIAESQRGVNWWIGDLARVAARRWPSTWEQIFPVWMSPDLIARCRAVSEAYPSHERNILATWSVHMKHANAPDRVALVQASVDAGQTSDEARKNPATPEPVVEPQPKPTKPDWLLAVDVNYYIHRYFHSGAGIEAASTFDGWLGRLIERLQQKGLTDVVCCLDSRTNHRKQLTEQWELGYKPRAEKDAELAGQLNLAPELLKARNILCVSIDDMEADDVMASYAVQFPGRVTLLTQDKDMRQCLSSKCNILKDVTWEENTETGQSVPVYQWVSAKQHTEEGMTYGSSKVVGITPEQWPHFQCIAGDSTDGIRGVEGIGGKGAMDLIIAHGSIDAVIAACKDGTANLSAIKRLAVLNFEEIKDVTMQLVTLVTDLPIPMVTKLCLKETA